MRLSSLKRTASAWLFACAILVPGASAAEPGRMLDYLTRASDDDAADYLAFLIRSYGCEVRREDRPDFNAAILDFMAVDFGLDVSGGGTDGAHLLSDAIRQGLFAFSYRAGPLLVERGELRIDAEGTARLTTCNVLTS